MKAQFTQKIIGTGERKALLIPFGEKAGQSVQYAGAPTFAYTAAGWSVDKSNMVSSPVFEIDDELENIAHLPELLRDVGAVPEGPLTLTIISDDPSDEIRASIMQALLQSKETLIYSAFGTDRGLAVTAVDKGYTFPFFSASLDHSYITAAIQFAHCIYEQSFQQKRVTSKDKPVENEKYAFRCFLLRIGMIGKEYSLARKTLLASLSGNSSFRNGERPRTAEIPAASGEPLADETTWNAANAALAAHTADDDAALAEALADAELIHGVNELMEGNHG